MIYFGEEADHVVGLKVDKHQFNSYEELRNQTIEYLQGNRKTIDAKVTPIKGKINKYDMEENKLLEDYFEGVAYKDFCVPCYIEEKDAVEGKMLWIAGSIMILFGLGYFILGMVRYKKRRDANKREAMIRNASASIKCMDYDMDSDRRNLF